MSAFTYTDLRDQMKSQYNRNRNSTRERVLDRATLDRDAFIAIENSITGELSAERQVDASSYSTHIEKNKGSRVKNDPTDTRSTMMEIGFATVVTGGLYYLLTY